MKRKVFKTRLIKTFFVILCFLSLFISTNFGTNVFATDNANLIENDTTNDLKKNAEIDIGVIAEIEDGFSIFIPKLIIIRYANMEEQYNVSIIGDLNNKKYIIVPEEEILMSNEKEDLAIAYLTVEKECFNKDNITIEGNVILKETVDNKRKTKYIGNVNFNVLVL